jgi:phosphate transport system permease protein
VRFADRVARLLIATGGIGTIAAVTTLCVYLLWVVVPLFRSPRAEPRGRAGAGSGTGATAVGVDEYLTLGWRLDEGGELASFRFEDGAALGAEPLFPQGRPSAFSIHGPRFTAGFGDGTIRTGSLGFSTRYLADGEVGEHAGLALGASAPFERGMLERTSAGQFRLQLFAPRLGEPMPSGAAVPLRRVDHVEGAGGPLFATLADDGVLRVTRTARKKNLLTGKEILTTTRGELALELGALGVPGWLLLSGLGDNVFLLWEDGFLWRCDARDLAAIRVAEKRDLVPEEGGRVTCATFLIGRTSLVTGDTLGRVRVWFRVKPAEASTPDGVELALAHEFPGPSPVRALAASSRGRTLAVGRDDGSVELMHVTSQRRLLRTRVPGGTGAVRALALGPKDDALLAATAEGTALWSLDAPHPETTLAALFRPVWYEGYTGPEHVWQSSSGTDDFESKYGLVPLVFGTIKATVYALLFGVPIALLAALYTSEFMRPGTKARVKPAIEMMASLPSVVLGFLSALVLAPLVEDRVPAVLAGLALVPFAACLGGTLWRALPGDLAPRLERWRLAFVGACMTAGLVAAFLLGPPLEHLFFAGDLRQWLTGSVGGASGGWALLLLPPAALVAGWVTTSRIDPWLARAARGLSPRRFACFDLAKFLASSSLVALGVVALGGILSRIGLDPRGGLLDTYVQRNALVVGFVMGFAIIPIVYTIAEDALAAVPDHLRAASLGAGATTWQTAVRVVVPTAMSGLFSAVMIGVGRAVGETMIVLMAAGNTPVMDWNVFNGFRTLSANIAVELPEAVQGSTHYRMLFLAALVLFAMTFALNTVAEAVRLRYRRRRVQL